MSATNDELHRELKRFIVRRLHLDRVDPDTIPDDAQLVGGGMELARVITTPATTGLGGGFSRFTGDAVQGLGSRPAQLPLPRPLRARPAFVA